ncbi:S-adenosylmethionine mitochondrial carrier protein [Tachyglossus aculeatus]|uniref:S-adenosylmethionine mitochondrial carrier protein n=1 Tax=Tachyglossus aculeatus TaxID=9261 RepID=UPI0018F58A61|nr:S-adenosylmethionine mitochondrial carrier protein [Tachyglossus aculeatus]
MDRPELKISLVRPALVSCHRPGEPSPGSTTFSPGDLGQVSFCSVSFECCVEKRKNSLPLCRPIRTSAGGIAGVSVDMILFPLDTIKTRLQSPQGFTKAGGFRAIYSGVPSTAIGSFPNAAAFFITYEYVKYFLHPYSPSYLTPVTHMMASSAGEVVACLIRVPSEVVKQRAQVAPSVRTFQIFSSILCEEGIQGLYRGYKSTVLREIPFSLVQFPVWESLKALWARKQDHAVNSWQSAVCGAFAGGFAAAVTTPLDVAKTRIMLAKAGSKTATGKVLPALYEIWRKQGVPGLFAGVFPRMAAISLGGFIFLGTYDQTRSLLL